MNKKPSSAKKHRELRRRRKVNWDYAREQMNKREIIFDKETEKFISELKPEDMEIL